MFRMKNVLVLMMTILAVIFLFGCSDQSGTEATNTNNVESESATNVEEENEEGQNESNEEQNENSSSAYPERPIDMVVGYGAGGGTDNFARAVAKELEDILDVTINVINKPGSTGAVATDYVINQPGDGYTIYVVPDHETSTAVGAYDYGLEYFKPVARLQKDMRTVQVKGSGEFETIEELFDAAEQNPNEIRIGGTGSVGTDELAVRKIEKTLGVEVNYVAFDEAGKMHAALLGDTIDAMIEEIGPTIAHIENGDIDVLVAWHDERLEDFPDVPVTAEFGWDDLTDGMTRGIIVHRDTPDDFIEILESALKEAIEQPDYKAYEESNYLHINDGWLGAEDYGKEMEERFETYSQIVEELTTE